MKKIVYIALITVLISLQLRTGNAYSQFSEQESISGNTFSTIVLPEATPTPTISPTITEVPEPSITPTPTPDLTPTISPSPTPLPTVTPIVTPTITLTPTLSPTPVYSPKVCPLVAGPNDILLNIEGKALWANLALSDAQYTVNGEVPIGTYKVTMTSYDNHRTKPGQYQPNEELFVILKDENGNEVTRTNAISDLPDYLDLMSETVNSNLVVSSNIKQLQPYHNQYPSQSNIANTIHAVCILFEPVEQESTPTPVIPNIEEVPKELLVKVPEVPVSSPEIDVEESLYQEECEIEVIEKHIEELEAENTKSQNSSFLQKLLKSLFDIKENETPEYIDINVYEEKINECIEEKEEGDTEITNDPLTDGHRHSKLQNTNYVVSPTPEISPEIPIEPTIIPCPSLTTPISLTSQTTNLTQTTNYLPAVRHGEVQNTNDSLPAQSTP